MMRATVVDLDEFWRNLSGSNLTEKFGVKLVEPTDVPWGREVNMIDIVGAAGILLKAVDKI